MKAEIICIGDELLIGQVVNTNAARMGELLNLAGIQVVHATVTQDNRQSILDALASAAKRADVILITGGLGPTKDDITKKVLCEYFKSEMVLSEEVLQDVKDIFERRGRVVTELNRKQAEVPAVCSVIRNKNGTAPGMWFDDNGKIYVSMPGVPFEMLPMLEETVIPQLKNVAQLPAIFHYTILTHGIGESVLAERIEAWEDRLSERNIRLAYLPSNGSVRLRLSAFGNNEEMLRVAVFEEVQKVLPLIEKHVYGYEEFGKPAPRIETVLADVLLKTGKKLALAESCTGGYIAHLVTSVPGSSAFFNGGIIPYHNEFKHSLLEVKNDVFISVGAVSEECVRQMAKGILEKFSADYAIAVSGIAGPTGGTDEKPVGTVWIAWASREMVVAEKFIFGKDRMRNIALTANAALNGLRQQIESGF